MTFEEFGLNDTILEAISYMGIEEPTPIQEMSIPAIMDRQDLIACAQTGTGKTAAFILPILHAISENKLTGVSTLILVPTRELAIQIDQEIQGIAYFADVQSLAIYGGGDGRDWDSEKYALKNGSGIIVATPGRLKAHLSLGYVNFSNIKYLILDEADRMLDIGFYEDIMKIISFLPTKRQSLMFSATMPPKVAELARNILEKPKEIKIEISKPAEGVLQGCYLVYENQKTALLQKMLAENPEYDSILVFTSTKRKVNEIVRAVKKIDKSVHGISSDLEQDRREEVLLKFKARETRILVATDVLSRGIDIKDINLVVNFDVPSDAEDYVHRVGRTARAKSTGVALTMINEDDMVKFYRIEQLIERQVHRLPLPDDFEDGPEWNPVFAKKKPKRQYNRKKKPQNKSKRKS